MPRRFTLGDLVSRCRKRCDMENQENIDDDEWKQLISTAYAELFSLVAETGLRYFEAEQTITTDGSSSYDEPVSMMSTVGVDYVVNTQGERRPLFEVMAQETAAYAGQSGEARAYALIDDQLYLYPTPPTGQTYLWRYVPQPPDLSEWGDDEVIDVATPDGEAFLIWAVAVQALAKEGSDTQLARAERGEARERVWNWAALRAFHSARRRIVDDDMGYDRDPADYWNRS